MLETRGQMKPPVHSSLAITGNLSINHILYENDKSLYIQHAGYIVTANIVVNSLLTMYYTGSALMVTKIVHVAY